MLSQRSEKWFADRCGKITASRLDDVLAVSADKWKVLRPSGSTLKVFDNMDAATTAYEEQLAMLAEKSKPTDQWNLQHCPGAPLEGFKNYMATLVCERLTGEAAMLPNTYQMEWGMANEPHALTAYEIRTGLAVQDCEFVPAPADTGLVTFGASPDGLVAPDGSIEIKCPSNSVNHLKCFVEGMPEKHIPQTQGQLLATGRDWCDFISFDPRMPAHLQLYIQRLEIDLAVRQQIIAGIARIEAGIVAFLAQLPQEGAA